MGLLSWLFGSKSEPAQAVRPERPTVVNVDVPKRHPRPADREAAKKWARGLLARRDWVIVDTDTTGSTEASQVIGIAVLGSDGTVLLNSLAKPKGRLPKSVTTYTGRTAEDFVDAPEYPTVHEQLMAVIKDKPVVAFPAAFHRKMIVQTAARYELKGPPFGWDCVQEQWSQFVGVVWDDDHERYKFQKRPGIEGKGALQDCQNTLALIRAMAGSRV